MKKTFKKLTSAFLALVMCLGITAVAGVTSAKSVVADAATDYYAPVTATKGNELLGQLHDLITTSRKGKYTSYGDCRTYGKTTDPGKGSNTVLEFYTHIDISNSKWDVSGGWNREHVWPKSLSGGLWGTSGGGSDLHHIRPSEKDLNNNRGNLKYGKVNNGKEEYTSVSNVLGGHSNSTTFEPLNNVKGDVARILMYVYTHYNSYTYVNGTTNGSGSAKFGSLRYTQVITASNEDAAKKLLLEWNKLDPVDEIERYRNDEVYKIQGNRNPFIDNSTYADAIWGNGSATTEPIDPSVKLTGLTVSPATLSLEVGQSRKLTVTPIPANASYSVKWSTTDGTVATVSNGTVTAKGEGTARIYAASTDDASIKAYADITVTESTTPAPPSAFEEGTYNLALNITATDITKKLYFTGALSGTSASTSYFGATSEDVSDAAEVVAAKDGDGFTLKVGAKYLELGSYTNNSGTTSCKLVLSDRSNGVWSFNTELKVLTWTLTVNGLDYYLGTYTNKSGKTFETISGSETKYISGENASKVGVSQFPVSFEKVTGDNPTPPEPPVTLTGLTLSLSSLSLEAGQTRMLTVTPVPANADGSVTWSTSAAAVATVTNGNVTAVSEGTAVITATSTVNPEIKASVAVTVTAAAPLPPKTLKISPAPVTMKAGAYVQVSVEGYALDEITWSSSDAAVATVGDDGRITGLKAGQCTVTAALKSDPESTGKVEVTVTAAEPAEDSNEVKEFKKAVTGLASVERMGDVFVAVKKAIGAYNALDAAEKESVAAERIVLEAAITAYNAMVSAANTEAASAGNAALLGMGSFTDYIGALIKALESL